MYQTQQQIEKLEREQAAHAQEAQQPATSSSDPDQAADEGRASSGGTHAPAAATDSAAHAGPEAAAPSTPAAPADAQSQVFFHAPGQPTQPFLHAYITNRLVALVHRIGCVHVANRVRC